MVLPRSQVRGSGRTPPRHQPCPPEQAVLLPARRAGVALGMAGTFSFGTAPGVTATRSRASAQGRAS